MAKPELRLKGFDGDWKKVPFGSLLKECSDKSTIENEDILLSSAIEGMFLNSELFGHQRGKSNIGYRKIRKNMLILSAQNLHLGNANVNLRFDHGLVSPAYKIYDILGCSPRFMFHWIKRDQTKQFFLDATTAGASLCRKNIVWKDLYNQSLYIPNSEREQEDIAKYCLSLDSTILATTKKIASLKQMKSASLISMFPQAGETKPRVRFKGFEGEWEDVSFKEISYLAGTKNRDNLPLESYSISNEFGFIPQNEQFENGGTMSNADKRMYYIVSPDSFAYNPARINVGSIGYDDLDKDVIVSSLYVVFKTDDDTYNPFLNYWFKTPMFKKMIELYQEGGVRLYFFYDKLCNCHFRRPSLKEQQHIASYFRSLDKQISLQEQRLEKLKQIKSACLDKMFV